MACIDCTFIQGAAPEVSSIDFRVGKLLSNSVCLSCHRVKTNTTLNDSKRSDGSLYRPCYIQHGSWTGLCKGAVAVTVQGMIDLVHVVHDERTVMGNGLSMGSAGQHQASTAVVARQAQ